MVDIYTNGLKACCLKDLAEQDEAQPLPEEEGHVVLCRVCRSGVVYRGEGYSERAGYYKSWAHDTSYSEPDLKADLMLLLRHADLEGLMDFQIAGAMGEALAWFLGAYADEDSRPEARAPRLRPIEGIMVPLKSALDAED